MKKIISLVLTVAMMISMVIVSSDASISHDSKDYAVFLQKDFSGRNSMMVNGDIYTAGGDVTFSNTINNKVNGNIIMSKSKKYSVTGQNELPTITGRVITTKDTLFNEVVPIFPDFPVISHVVDYYEASWWPDPITIKQSTHYKTLKILNYVNVDVSKGDIILVVDDLTLSGNINLIGDGRLFIFVKGNLKSSGPCNIAGNPNKLIFYVNGNFELTGDLNANVYLNNASANIALKSKLTGNLVTKANSLVITGGSAKVYGVVYAPNADVKVSSANVEPQIKGRLVAKSLDIFQDGIISYDSSAVYTFEKPEPAKNTVLSVTASPVAGGTVTPASGNYAIGDEVVIQASANPGYKFIGFVSENGTAIPDLDGKITIQQDTYLVAQFEEEKKSEIIDEIPAGAEITIDFPYGYLYGYGYGSHDVGVQDNIKREEAVALIYRLLKNNNKLGSYITPNTSTFDDVETNRWSFSAIEYMTSIGIYKSSDDNIYAGASITRGEAAKIISCALRIRPNSNDSVSQFVDLPTTNPYYTYVKALVDKGVMNGNGDNTITPNNNITRAEFIKMVNVIIGRTDAYDISDLECPYEDLAAYDASSWEYQNMMKASYGFSYDEVTNKYVMDPSMKPAREVIDYR